MTDKPSLRLVGGHLALNLMNTVEPRVPGALPEKEHLGTPDELLDWCVRAGVVDAGGARAVRRAWGDGAQALHAVVAIREALYAVLMSRLNPAVSDVLEVPPALEQLTLRWSAAAARSALVLGDTLNGAVRIAVGSMPAFAVQDRLAASAVDFLRSVHLPDVRVCPVADGGCGWLFLDRSRNHSRRWCAMADCGARVKARRLTSRRQEERATGETRNDGS